jgi:hypothetical protein
VETPFGAAPVNVLVGNPKANGLPLPETNVDYQDISSYIEYAFSNRFSAFAEVPFRFLNPQVNNNTAGLADMNAGFKWAFIYSPEQVATYQLRTYIPTGASSRGLGTNHVSLEPALLYWRPLTDRLLLEAELRDWIPIGGTDFEGNVVRYGAGVSYRLFEGPGWTFTPVTELVGWTVLNGKETNPLGNNVFEVVSAGGNTIVNAKIGGHFRWGEGLKNDFYVGYGRALTGDVWYKDIIRVQFRRFF